MKTPRQTKPQATVRAKRDHNLPLLAVGRATLLHAVQVGNMLNVFPKPTNLNGHWPTDPIFALPATKEAVEMMVEQGARAMWLIDKGDRRTGAWQATWNTADRVHYLGLFRTALSALSLTSPPKP